MSDLGVDPTRLALSAYPVGIAQATSSAFGLTQTQNATQAINSDGDGDGSGSTDPAASTHISRSAQFVSKLQQLQAQDPARFKQVLTDIADKLGTAAQNSTGQDQKFLSGLASKFQQAANGDLSALQPPQQTSSTNGLLAAYGQNGQANDPLQPALSPLQHGGHHHHHHAISANTQQTLSSIFSKLNSALSNSSTGSSTDGSLSDPFASATTQQTLQAAA